jgi:hypothetical protein
MACFPVCIYPKKLGGGAMDRASMLLGLYEKEILDTLQHKPDNYRIFIDIGAADGYYGVGAVKSGLFDISYCYEITEDGRSVIKQNSIDNGVSENIVIRGQATQETLSDFDSKTLSESLVLIDIEGFEFSLLNTETVKLLHNAIIIIEMHEWFFIDGDAKFDALIDLFQSTHKIEILKMGSRDLSVFPELDGLNDSDRWLICSEGRARMMRWLHLTPLAI